MAKKLDMRRTYNVSVVGLSGTEKEKGPRAIGVGKSCFCNRFMTPVADEYYTDHISVLGQTDFGGRVVNNDHFLYWGDVTKTTDNGEDLVFHVIEQTEFVDDSSFQPFRSNKTDPYHKRCAATKVTSAEKLAYICKNQLGLEHEFNQKYLPEGKLNVDGFVCLFDVSKHQPRRIEQQIDIISNTLNNLMKSKKPIVLATSKHDEASDVYVREAEKLVGRREYKGAIQLVETSAHHNVNVELAFVTLAHTIDKTRGRIKTLPYAEAARARQEILDAANGAYRNLIRSRVSDYKGTWSAYKKQFAQNADYIHFVELFGVDAALRQFRQHVKKLSEEHLRIREDGFLKQIPEVLNKMLPDLNIIGTRSWKSCQNLIHNHEDFDEHFVVLSDDAVWSESDYVDCLDTRIPFDLLDCKKAEFMFDNHVTVLKAEYARLEMRQNFKSLLLENPHVLPGKQLQEVAIFFLGKVCFDGLSEKDRTEVFERHQKELREKAKAEFSELLHEYSMMFARYANDTVTTEDLQNILEELKEESKYKNLRHLEEDRKVMILNHLGFVQFPSRDRCPFRETCMENHLESVLSNKAHRPESWYKHSNWMLDSQDSRLNLVLLGKDNLANELVEVIRVQCNDDEYHYNDQFFNLDYNAIDGDVSLPQNAFRSSQFVPHGCFCVYSSRTTLEYIWESLEKTLMSDLERDRLPFQGLPIVIIFAYDSSVNEKALTYLREEGKSLAERLQCPFIDIPNAQFSVQNENSRFHASQIHLALKELIQSIRHRAGFINPYQVIEPSEPDIRIVMCLMCGDDFTVDLPLGPLLSHQCCYVTIDREKYHTVTLETYLGDSKRKVEVVVTSYHGASLLMDNLIHGYILVYSAKRKASLSTLSAFAESLPSLRVPVQIIAVTVSGGANAFFGNEQSQSHITEGNALADKLNARFTTTSPTFIQQTAAFTPFFKDVWDKKSDTELSYPMSGDEMYENSPYGSVYDSMAPDRRPPAILPRPAYMRSVSYGGQDVRVNGENGHEYHDSDIDVIRCQSDSEHDRASSVSPPLPSVTVSSDIYSSVSNEISPYLMIQRDKYGGMPKSFNDSEMSQSYNEHLVRPSQIKKKENADVDLSLSLENFKAAEKHQQYHRQSCHTVQLLNTCKSAKNAPENVDKKGASESPKSEHSAKPAGCSKSIDEDNQPHYQFRKTKSMKLALKEYDEAPSSSMVPWREGYIYLPRCPTLKNLHLLHTLPEVHDSYDYTCWAINSLYVPSDAKRLHKASTLPGQSSTYQAYQGWKENYLREGQQLQEDVWEVNNHLRNTDKNETPSPQKLNLSRFKNVREKIENNIRTGKVTAPLATPEPIEFIEDYAQVADAITGRENDYALVQDALPPGNIHRIRSKVKKQEAIKRSDSEDSEFSSLERRNRTMYTKANRKPTPHKKKTKRQSDSLHSDMLPLLTQREKLGAELTAELTKVRSNSPSEGSEGTGDELQQAKKQKKRRSFRTKKTKKPRPSEESYCTSPSAADTDALVQNMSTLNIGMDQSYEGDESRGLLNTEDGSNWRTISKFLPKRGNSETEKQRKREKERQKRRKEEERKRQKTLRKSKKMKGPPGSAKTGKSLDDYVQKEQRLKPIFVEKCINYIEVEGLTAEGIYRVPGNKAHVDLLNGKFAEDPNIDIYSLELPVNAVATALKAFFNELNDPLIPSYLYDELIEAAEWKIVEGIPDKSARLLALRGVLKKLPPVNHEVLKFLMSHINKISQHKDENSMSTTNLAICWWPTLLRPDFTSFDKMAMASKYLEEIVRTIIEQCGFFFYNEPEV